MKACPGHPTLRQFLGSQLTAQDEAVISQHIESCTLCQHQLDELAEVASASKLLSVQQGRAPHQEPSPALYSVMARLSSEHQSLIDTPSESATSDQTWIGQKPELPLSERSGFIGKLGTLEIRRVLGKGGMGVVYEGLDTELNRKVAVKVLSPHLLGDATAQERFLREAQAAAAVTHENIVTIHSIHKDPSMPYLVLQYVEGESLADVLTRRKKLPPEDVIQLGAEVARGLTAAHSHGLVHRDIKPGNILLEKETGQIRIADFGLAKKMGTEAITNPQLIAGTPAYMSPEQALGQPIDAKTDLFSLGIVLYQALSGQLPFSGDSPYAVLHQVQSKQQTPLKELDSSIPTWLSDLVDGLMQKDPGKRLCPAAKVAELLQAQVSPSRTHTSLKQPKASWLGWAIAGLLASLLIAIGVYYFWNNPNPINEVENKATASKLNLTGYQIGTEDNTYRTLSEAVEAAKDGDIITLHGRGPHVEKLTNITGKKLTIQAAPGNKPVITSEQGIRNTTHQWIHTDSDLTLEGLDIRWLCNAQRPFFDLTNSLSTIGSEGKKLTIRNCTIIAPRNSTAISGPVKIMEIFQSRFYSDQGIAVLLQATSGAKLRMEQSVLLGGFGIMLGLVPLQEGNPELVTCDWSENTFQSRVGVGFMYSKTVRGQIAIRSERNLMNTEYLFCFPYTRLNAIQSDLSLLKEKMKWTEKENVYSSSCKFVGALQMQGLKMFDHNMGSNLPEWLSTWNQKDSASIQAEISINPGSPDALPKVRSIDKPTGPIPSLVGAPSTR